MQELLGATARTDHPGLRVPANPNLLNAHGTLHGGVVVAVAEHAATRHQDTEGMHLSALNTTFLRPAHGELTVEVRDTHRGRTLSVLEVAIADATRRSCAVSTATYRRREILR
ncbi:hotdog fold thioesterase [Arthrobacter sp. UCD-GKA]|uniref:PaaI family thioesterase n=1 Tax=Arthrobacter sp. UCD-GKA TaxID=1913576 RepID=UPI00336A18F5